MTIKWNGRDVHGSPFTVNIHARNEESSSDDNNDNDKINTDLNRLKTLINKS